MYSIDLNCDLGESFGCWKTGRDEELLALVTSANIACGFHAGDPGVMRRTVELALSFGVAVGAHPGLPDLQGFGRRELAVTPSEARDLVLYQLGALAGFVQAAGGRLHHVKPHGALYNMAARDPRLAGAIAAAVREFDAGLVLVGLAGSALLEAGRAAGLKVAGEVFADRTYLPDGSLTPRSRPDALLHDEVAVAARVLRMVREGTVESVESTPVSIHADTVCLHGDGANSLSLARAIRAVLQEAGIRLAPVACGPAR